MIRLRSLLITSNNTRQRPFNRRVERLLAARRHPSARTAQEPPFGPFPAPRESPELDGGHRFPPRLDATGTLATCQTALAKSGKLSRSKLAQMHRRTLNPSRPRLFKPRVKSKVSCCRICCPLLFSGLSVGRVNEHVKRCDTTSM